ncbi:hypothetical protein Agub_g542 [Astrephomene gubernaculifera]|uniref:Uncharacterized protein n=1 Tax=Astrephomene gubernaculifera TaxID=47775 RepID=A0AAD3DFX3_9CHLO|nr:hypothetical protein Agub_g542 [Astrephomene gubernaculifera]
MAKQGSALLKDAVDFYKKEKKKVALKAASSRAWLLALTVPEIEGWRTVDLEEPITLYVVGASVRGELVSLHDDQQLKYAIGRWTHSKHGACSWPPMYACFYGHQLRGQAMTAVSLPKKSKLQDAPKVLIQVEAKGKSYFQPQTGIWAVPSVRPTRLMPGAASPETAAEDVA